MTDHSTDFPTPSSILSSPSFSPQIIVPDTNSPRNLSSPEPAATPDDTTECKQELKSDFDLQPHTSDWTSKDFLGFLSHLPLKLRKFFHFSGAHLCDMSPEKWNIVMPNKIMRRRMLKILEQRGQDCATMIGVSIKVKDEYSKQYDEARIVDVLSDAIKIHWDDLGDTCVETIDISEWKQRLDSQSYQLLLSQGQEGGLRFLSDTLIYQAIQEMPDKIKEAYYFKGQDLCDWTPHEWALIIPNKVMRKAFQTRFFQKCATPLPGVTLQVGRDRFFTMPNGSDYQGTKVYDVVQWVNQMGAYSSRVQKLTNHAGIEMLDLNRSLCDYGIKSDREWINVYFSVRGGEIRV